MQPQSYATPVVCNPSRMQPQSYATPVVCMPRAAWPHSRRSSMALHSKRSVASQRTAPIKPTAASPRKDEAVTSTEDAAPARPPGRRGKPLPSAPSAQPTARARRQRAGGPSVHSLSNVAIWRTRSASRGARSARGPRRLCRLPRSAAPRVAETCSVRTRAWGATACSSARSAAAQRGQGRTT